MNIIKVIQAKEVFSPYLKEKLSVALSYKIYKICKFAEQEEVFYNQKINDIIQEFAQRNEQGDIETNENGGIKIIEEKIDEANQAAKDLGTLDVEAPKIRFTLDELSEIKLSVIDIAALDDFIEDSDK